ncbi:hypothetical protein D1BOALGB6SA_10638 [Olavius sp. associated proteobacterium Delta 1]|nr:hypothetical protein D1BOALGB6SA_10638 [Olavius sp. associated proteobacterium Delta 1]
MPEELIKLLIIIGLSLAVGILFSVPVIVWRAIKRRPLLPKGKKIESPRIFYFGFLLFGGFATISFFIGRPYFGSAFLMVLFVYVCGFIVYKLK